MSFLSSTLHPHPTENILQHAIEKVPFYKRNKSLDASSLLNFPLVTKYEIRNKYAQFISDDFGDHRENLVASLTEVRPIGPSIYERIDENGILIGQTGGSSGTPFRVPKSINDRIRMGIGIWKQRQAVDPNVLPESVYRFVHTGLVPTKFDAWSVDKYNIDGLYNDVRESKSTWLHTYAPLLVRHMEFCLKNDVIIDLPHLNYIECSGYYVDQETVAALEDFYKAKVINQYGMMETWTISLTCKHGYHHINEDNVHVEILDDIGARAQIGQLGRIVVTSLNATLLPFIRYVTNDYGCYTEKRCSCSLGSQTIEISKYRVSELIAGAGRIISGTQLFRRALKKALITTGYDDLVFFRVVQTEASKFKIMTNRIREPEVLIDKIRAIVIDELGSHATIDHAQVDQNFIYREERKPWVFRCEVDSVDK